MVVRLGVGATTASAIIFSVLLVSNVMVYAAAQERASHYAQADAEDSMADGADVLMGAGAANILLSAQGVLSSRTFDCSDARAEAALGVGALSEVQAFGGVTAKTIPVGVVDLTGADNLSIVTPFNGALEGDFDIVLSISITGTDAGAGVSFNRTEGHLVHIPVRLDEMSAVCVAALEALGEAVAGSSGTNCTSAAGPAVQSAEHEIAAEAASVGFSAGVGYAVRGSSSCTVSFAVWVEQSGIDGPGGEFSVKMEGAGAASFAPHGAR